ncbi:MAG: phosphoglycerol transferase MdoB-like AlkP superfamily enzyme [Bacteroidia bacterium]|jgi:phosphoglycerol transferase MdoB-like AlkP superfamily enzyme
MADQLSISDPLNYWYYAIRFDLKTIAIWYAPLYLLVGVGLWVRLKCWFLVCKSVFIVLYALLLVFGVIAVFYYPISKSIVGIELFQMLGGQDVTILSSYLLDYWYAFILALLSLYTASVVYSKLSFVVTKKQSAVYSLVSLSLIVFLARGGIALKPLNILDGYAHLESNEVVTAITPAYVLLESYGKSTLEYTPYFSEEELQVSLADDIQVFNEREGQLPNICVILLESFGAEYTKINRSDRPSYTPFLDSLMNVSINFTNAYANGLRSMDAVASVFGGVPSLMKQPLIGSLYSTVELSALPAELDEQGYYSSFYHAADELSMGFKPFLLSQGLDDYLAKQQYPNQEDFDGTWGIFDMPYLQYVSEKLTEQHQPWISGIFTLSSHHPYTIPEKYKNLPKGTSEIHQSVGYTDEALRQFFESAKNKSWFANTVFIITADHTSINQTKPHATYRGKYTVPLIIYSPSRYEARVDTSVAQHLDVHATVLQIAGKKEFKSLGRSLLENNRRYSIQYDGNVYVCTSDSLTLQWNGVAKPKLFAYRTDAAHTTNIASMKPDDTIMMLDTLKMYIQKYNYRLLNNDFK